MMSSLNVATVISIPTAAGMVLTGVGLATLAYSMFHPQSQLLCRVISRGDSNSGPNVALTFDDGPWPESTDAILRILQDARVHAAFFVIGRHVQKWPDLVRRMHDDGHLIGNHSFDHHRWGLFRGKRYWIDQIARADDAIASVTGQPAIFFRPPMGFKSPHLVMAARDRGKTIIAWSRRGFDGVATSPQRIVKALGNKIKAGEIVLLHDGRDPASHRDVNATSKALSIVINRIRGQGLNLVRLDALIGGSEHLIAAQNSTLNQPYEQQ